MQLTITETANRRLLDLLEENNLSAEEKNLAVDIKLKQDEIEYILFFIELEDIVKFNGVIYQQEGYNIIISEELVNIKNNLIIDFIGIEKEGIVTPVFTFR